MRLFYRKYILYNNQFFNVIDGIKRGITVRDMQAVDDYAAS